MIVEHDGAPLQLGGAKQRAVLALLVASPGRAVSAERILVGVWGEDTPESNRASLHTYVSNLRAIVENVISRSGDGYRLAVTPDRIDAFRFERELEEARRLLPTDAEHARARLRDALAMWRGRPYADLADFHGLQPEIRRLEELRLAAVELRIDADLAAGASDSIIAEVGALAEEHPLRERFRAQHMLALYRAGRQAEALRAYQRTKQHLATELGIAPSQELHDLELAIIQQDDELRIGPGRPTMQRLAFLVTDIVDSTRMWDAAPRRMADALMIHDRIVSDAIQSSGGVLFKHTGDGMMAAFPDVTSTVECAEAIQRRLGDQEWETPEALRVRVGVDVGEVEARGGDFYGPPVNRATRLTGAAHGGQVLVSQTAHAELAMSAPAGVQIRQLGEHRLKGFATAERVFQLVFVGLPGDFPEINVDAAPAPGEPLLGVSVPGYEIREQIGAGAFGVVYRAYQPSVGREVAVKVIRPELASHPAFIHRFEAEARTVARLAHPRIVPLIDFWRDSEGAFLVLQLLPGGSLGQLLASGDVDRGTARLILGHVAEALDHAHAHGISHGDLNPANVLLDASYNAYLSDFAIPARILDPEVVASVSASAGFRAPEVDITGPSPPADIFALGMIARRLLSDADTEPVLARAAAADPGDRFPTAAAFVAELDAALGEEPSELPQPAVARNPYKGLRPFAESDASDFFGREELVATLVAAVAGHRFVAVVGPSGSGKSSVVQAGLLPRIRRADVDAAESWLPVVMTPGTHPIESLVDALDSVATGPADLAGMLEERGLDGVVRHVLRDLPGDLVLVVDQFEELFTLTDDHQRTEFLTQLETAALDDESRLRVVATLRADFYDRPLERARLGRLVRDGQVTVLRPTGTELLEMITGPGQAVGLRWEPGLPHRIAQEIADQPGGLPLLQYALTEIVERRRGDLLTSADYDRIGGVVGALASRAESAFSELSADQQSAARQVLLRLVSVDEDADDTRRRVRLTELESLGIDRGDLEVVLTGFTSERLLLADRDPVTRGPTVEVAHEALLREWPRLRGWIESQREGLILGRRFRAAMGEWTESGRDDGYLLTGSRLAPFAAWAETSALSSEERAFFEAARQADLERLNSARRRRRRLMFALIAAALVASTLAAWALAERDRATEQAALTGTEAKQRLVAQQKAEAQADLAEEQRILADQHASLARSRELAAAAISVLDEDPTLSKLLSLASADIAEPPLESVSALHRAHAADRVTARYSWPDHIQPGWQLWAHPHPSGERLVAAGADGLGLGGFTAHLEVVDIDTGDVVWSQDVEHPEVALDRPRFTPDGSRVVGGALWESRTKTGPEPATDEVGVFVWDADTGDLIERIDLGTCGGTVQALSGTLAMVRSIPETSETCWFDGEGSWILELIDLDSGERTALTTGAIQGLGTVDGGGAFSGDGRIAAFDDGRGRMVALDMQTGERISELTLAEPDDFTAFVRRLDEDGSHLVYGREPIRIIEIATGETRAEIDVTDAWIALRDDVLLATTDTGDLRAFDISTGAALFEVPNTGNGNVEFVSDHRVMVSDAATGAVAIDTGPRAELGLVETCPGLTKASLDVGGGLAAFMTSCDEDQLAPGLIRTTAAVSSTVVVDLTTTEVEYSLDDAKGTFQPISPDGSRFVRQQGEGGLLTGPLVVRDLATGRQLVELEGFCWWDAVEMSAGESDCITQLPAPFAMAPSRVHWSPDGSMVAAVNAILRHDGGFLAVWDAETGELLFTETGIGELSHHVDAIFTPDSSGLVASYWGPAIRRFSTDTWTIEHEEPFPGVSADSQGISFVGYTGDGDSLVAVGNLNVTQALTAPTGSLIWLDADSLEARSSRANVHESEITAKAIHPDGTLVATGSADGVVRVWESDTHALVHEVPMDIGTVRGVAFIDDTRLAVTPQLGDLLIMTYDTDRLIALARDSLTRGFTPLECAKFNFGDDCPSLEELMRGPG